MNSVGKDKEPLEGKKEKKIGETEGEKKLYGEKLG